MTYTCIVRPTLDFSTSRRLVMAPWSALVGTIALLAVTALYFTLIRKPEKQPDKQ
jgi:hypothetical protein